MARHDFFSFGYAEGPKKTKKSSEIPQLMADPMGKSGKSSSSGWWYTYPPEKYEFVNWDDDYSQYMGK